ncbi:unnamed protein product, partial [Amoebophrya sp. A120]|eukprot:GSA120T00019695001.1
MSTKDKDTGKLVFETSAVTPLDECRWPKYREKRIELHYGGSEAEFRAHQDKVKGWMQELKTEVAKAKKSRDKAEKEQAGPLAKELEEMNKWSKLVSELRGKVEENKAEDGTKAYNYKPFDPLPVKRTEDGNQILMYEGAPKDLEYCDLINAGFIGKTGDSRKKLFR